MDAIALTSRDGRVSGTSIEPGQAADKPLLVCVHGGGCNGHYFDLPGYSVAAAAAARGYRVLLVHRPGHGGNPVPDGADPVRASVPAIRAFIDEVRGDRPISMLAHSIGGVAAFELAAARGDWPLRGLAVHGIGDRPAPPLLTSPRTGATGKGVPPDALDVSMFFGQPGTYAWDAAPKLRRISEGWLLSEVEEIIHDWPTRWPDIAGAIDVPVHLRLADGERIWETGTAVVRRMADRLTAATLVDAALLEGGGHLYEIHKRGPELVASQLDFLDAC